MRHTSQEGITRFVITHVSTLTAAARGEGVCPTLSRQEAIQTLGLLGQKAPLNLFIELLEEADLAELAYEQLVKNVYLFEAYYNLVAKYPSSNTWVNRLLKDFANKEWLTRQPPLAASLEVVVFKVPYSVTAEMLSPLKAAWNRADVVLHAQSFLSEIMPEGVKQIQSLKQSGYPVAFVTPEINTSQSRYLQRNSAVQSLLWHIGESDTLRRGVILSEKTDDYFHDIAEDSGSLLLTVDTTFLNTGDVITIHPYQHRITLKDKTRLSFGTKRLAWQSIWRSGGYTPYTLGNSLTAKSNALLKDDIVLKKANRPTVLSKKGYTLAQKMIAKACGVEGVSQGEVCEPLVSAVILKESEVEEREQAGLADLDGYLAELVIKHDHISMSDKSDIAVTLKAHDGKPHALLDRLVIPDSVNISSDPYVRSPLGITLFTNAMKAAVTGSVSYTMPKSYLVRFQGKRQATIQLRDLAHAIAYFASQQGGDMKSEWENHIIEIEGLEGLSVEAAYELIDSMAIYGDYSCTVALDQSKVVEKLRQNKGWLQQFMRERSPKHRGLGRLLMGMDKWLSEPCLLKSDPNAVYDKTINISLETVREPLLATMQGARKIYTLPELARRSIRVDAVWIGSTALDLDHYRIVARLLAKYPTLKARLWLSPPSPVELVQLMKEGCYRVYGQRGVYTEMPDGSLCIQARLEGYSVVVATSTELFKGWNKAVEGYVASPALATITAILGYFPSLVQYQAMMQVAI